MCGEDGHVVEAMEHEAVLKHHNGGREDPRTPSVADSEDGWPVHVQHLGRIARRTGGCEVVSDKEGEMKRVCACACMHL